MVHHYDIQVRNRSHKPQLFAITGPAGCGKTTITNALISTLKLDGCDCIRVRFAGPLKAALRAIGLTEAQVDGDQKEVPSELLCGKTPRQAMRLLGCEFGRDLIGTDLWVNAAMQQADDAMSRGLSVVIDDLRFDNEAEALTRRGAVIVELQRDGFMYSAEHASEAGISPRYLTTCLDNNGDVADVIESILAITTKAQP